MFFHIKYEYSITLRKRFGIDIITEFKFISKTMLIVIKRYIYSNQ